MCVCACASSRHSCWANTHFSTCLPLPIYCANFLVPRRQWNRASCTRLSPHFFFICSLFTIFSPSFILHLLSVSSSLPLFFLCLIPLYSSPLHLYFLVLLQLTLPVSSPTLSHLTSQSITMEPTIPPLPHPYVLIAGAGLGGLLMGTLLERIGIPYHIFERAAKVKPLGN